MNIVKKLFIFTLFILSFSTLAQDYILPELKTGVQDDITSLILDSSNFSSETEYVFGSSIKYLKYNTDSVNIFKKYGTVSNEIIHPNGYNDQPEISSNYDLLSVGNEAKSWSDGHYIEYFQCVQFAQAISNAGKATNRWRESTQDNSLNINTDLSWRLIAKFSTDDGLYDGSDNGHVALAIMSNEKGVYVIDQNWEGSRSADYGKIGIHIIPWSEANNYALVTIPSSWLYKNKKTLIYVSFYLFKN